MSLTLSPFISALPLPHHLFFEYDEDGDAIMIDAATGERLNGGRHQSTETLVESPIAFVASPVAAVSPPSPPPAPARLPRFSLNPEDDEDEVAVRNLAEEMAEVVLNGEPREEAVPPVVVPVPPVEAPVPPVEAPVPPVEAPVPPPAGEPAAEENWCISVTVPDLALRLDMRHPRVVLNFFRFVTTYNELAPPGEEIHVPMLTPIDADEILGHVSVVDTVPEFAAEVAELRYLVRNFTCLCSDCSPLDEEDHYSTDSEDRDRYFSRDY
jgi:hypothetical protein